MPRKDKDKIFQQTMERSATKPMARAAIDTLQTEAKKRRSQASGKRDREAGSPPKVSDTIAPPRPPKEGGEDGESGSDDN